MSCREQHTCTLSPGENQTSTWYDLILQTLYHTHTYTIHTHLDSLSQAHVNKQHTSCIAAVQKPHPLLLVVLVCCCRNLHRMNRLHCGITPSCRYLQTDLAACTWLHVCIHDKIGTLWKPFSTHLDMPILLA